MKNIISVVLIITATFVTAYMISMFINISKVTPTAPLGDFNTNEVIKTIC